MNGNDNMNSKNGNTNDIKDKNGNRNEKPWRSREFQYMVNFVTRRS